MIEPSLVRAQQVKGIEVHYNASTELLRVAVSSTIMAFDLAERLTRHHLIVQPSDLALNPPESYLFVQDALIISCGVIYGLCYVFYMARTYKDKTISGPVEFL